MLTFNINGQDYTCTPGNTILQVARQKEIDIPTLCYLHGRQHRSVCRICVVDVAGLNSLAPACSTLVTEGMEITTNSTRVISARKVLMRFIMAEHGQCGRAGCAVEELAAKLGVLESAPLHIQGPIEVDRQRSSTFMQITPSHCIHCDRCIRSCRYQMIGRKGRGVHVSMNMNTSSCVYCGDCIDACPTGAIMMVK